MARRYGWKPDLPDKRDRVYALARPQPLPARVDLRERFPVPAYDQGELGSCTANAVAAAVQYLRRQAGEAPEFVPSRLAIYFNERLMEGTRLDDAGATIRDSVKSVVRFGVCPEESSPPQPYDWPYRPERFVLAPPDAAYVFGRAHQAVEYARVNRSLSDLRGCLAAGFPFVFGIAVYESFESAEVARTGVVPLPGQNEAMLGGHALSAFGYDDASHSFIVRNSWGSGWGQKGYCLVPYAYLLDDELADDFWRVTRIEA
jgi:C1A family cysteine protease